MTQAIPSKNYRCFYETQTEQELWNTYKFANGLVSRAGCGNSESERRHVMTDEAGIIDTVVRMLDDAGVDIESLGFGWARAMPLIAIVPAFGLRAHPIPLRIAMALCLGACIAPSLHSEASQGPWLWGLASSLARGVPIAMAAAIPMWAATMTGGVIDSLRGSNDTWLTPVVEGRPSMMGVPLSLLASLMFLASGAPAYVVGALAEQPPMLPLLARVAMVIASGIRIATLVAGPAIAASVVFEMASSLVARVSHPTQINATLAPLRSLAILAVVGYTLSMITTVMSNLIARGSI